MLPNKKSEQLYSLWHLFSATFLLLFVTVFSFDKIFLLRFSIITRDHSETEMPNGKSSYTHAQHSLFGLFFLSLIISNAFFFQSNLYICWSFSLGISSVRSRVDINSVKRRDRINMRKTKTSSR